MKDSVVILGAAALQVPLINYIKEKGYRTIVVSIPGNYPGFNLADRCIFQDIRNGEAILKELESENVISVLTDETDMSVPTVAYLASALNLPGNTMESALAYSNKYLMREACLKAEVPVPKYTHISSINNIRKELEGFVYPVIMKPEDNQGSRGIFVVNDIEGVIYNFPDSQQFSKTGHVIVEEYFEGKEYVVEGFVFNGEYLNWGIAERKYFQLSDFLIPSQTIFPSLLEQDIQSKLISSEEKLHKKLSPNFGMIHSEYLVNEETGDFILVETALRGGGVYISSHLVPLYTSYNNYELLFNCSIGNAFNLSEVSKHLNRKSSAYICFYLPEGEIVSIEGVEDVVNMPCVYKVDVDGLYVGMKTEKLVNKTMRLGPIIIGGEDRQTVERTIKEVQNTLRIRVKKTDGEYSEIIWQ